MSAGLYVPREGEEGEEEDQDGASESSGTLGRRIRKMCDVLSARLLSGG